MTFILMPPRTPAHVWMPAVSEVATPRPRACSFQVEPFRHPLRPQVQAQGLKLHAPSSLSDPSWRKVALRSFRDICVRSRKVTLGDLLALPTEQAQSSPPYRLVVSSLRRELCYVHRTRPRVSCMMWFMNQWPGRHSVADRREVVNGTELQWTSRTGSYLSLFLQTSEVQVVVGSRE